jgi:hypothetical protein
MHTTEWEREYRQKRAGLRTYTLVGLGSVSEFAGELGETDPD